MIKKIKTEKFEGLAVLVPDDAINFIFSVDHTGKYLNWDDGLFDEEGFAEGGELFLTNDSRNKFKIVGKSTELTEEQCAEIVSIGMDYYEPAYKNYVAEADSLFKYPFDTAKESFASLMESIGCYAVNPYGEKEPEDISDLGAFTQMMRQKWVKWQEAQKQTGIWVILKKL